jgi:DNA invertase Pin-like site-specific DNA recombinase
MSKEKIKLCVGYARVSSRQQKDTGLSLDAQSDYLQNWVKDNGFDIVKIFKVQESASKAERPYLFECFKYCVDNGIKDILITDSDRWTRSRELDIRAQKFIKENSLLVHIVKERKIIGKHGTAAEKFAHNVKTDTDEFIADIIGEKSQAGLAQRLSKNHYPGVAPIGYENIGKSKMSGAKIIPSADFEKVKTFLLRFNKGGYSLVDMERFAKNIGLKSKSGKELLRPSINWMLKNPFYYGEFKYTLSGQETKTYQNETPGFIVMISRKQYKKNQIILKAQRVNLSDKRGNPWKYKNFIECGKCGRTFLAEKTTIKYKHKKLNKKTGKKIPTGKITTHNYVQYHCSWGFYYENDKGSLIAKSIIEKDEVGNFFYKENNRIIYAERKKCNTGCIGEAELGRLLSLEFSGIQFKKEVWTKIKNHFLIDKKRVLKLITEELGMLRSEDTKNRAMQKFLLQEKFEGGIDKDLFDEQMAELKERQIEVKERIKILEDDKEGYDNKIQQSLKAINVINDFGSKFKSADQKVKKHMVDLMCSKIFITGGEKIFGTGKKVPYSLYVDWNDEFKDLYDTDLVVLPEEIAAKYKLPKKVFTKTKNEHRGLFK